MQCRKQVSKTPHYKIEIKTANEELSQIKEGGYVGSLRSNFKASQFYLFDGGSKDDEKDKKDHKRRQYATIIYTSDSIKKKKPR